MAGEGNGGDLIQVKLEVLDNGNSVVDHWMLPVEHVTIEITRQPVVFTIPTGPTAPGSNFRQNRPMAYALDLSMMNEMVILSGVSIDNQRDAAQPSAPNLREIARTHWFGIIPTVTDDGKFTSTGGIRLTINEGPGQGTHAYQGAIVNLTTERDGGDTKWSWKMTTQVFYWPWDMNP